jgi:hypothetical protein
MLSLFKRMNASGTGLLYHEMAERGQSDASADQPADQPSHLQRHNYIIIPSEGQMGWDGTIGSTAATSIATKNSFSTMLKAI